MATWFQAAPWLRKRIARRSIMADGSSVGAPQTWQRKPCSAKESEKLMPDLASCREVCTSLALLPIDDTMPRPVTTTRLIRNSFQGAGRGCRSADRRLLGQTDLQIRCRVYGFAIRLQ